MSDQDETPRKLTLESCVRAFLELALIPPEKPPKRIRDQRDNEMHIIGYNRAQEHLRTILKEHGAAADIVALADVRSDSQRQPMDGPGGLKLWVAS